MGIAIALLMMFSLGWETWARLMIWLAIGVSIYFAYGFKHSKVRMLKVSEPQSKAVPFPAD